MTDKQLLIIIITIIACACVIGCAVLFTLNNNHVNNINLTNNTTTSDNGTTNYSGVSSKYQEKAYQDEYGNWYDSNGLTSPNQQCGAGYTYKEMQELHNQEQEFYEQHGYSIYD